MSNLKINKLTNRPIRFPHLAERYQKSDVFLFVCPCIAIQDHHVDVDTGCFNAPMCVCRVYPKDLSDTRDSIIC